MFAFTFDINRIYTVIDGVVTLLPCVFQLIRTSTNTCSTSFFHGCFQLMFVSDT